MTIRRAAIAMILALAAIAGGVSACGGASQSHAKAYSTASELDAFRAARDHLRPVYTADGCPGPGSAVFACQAYLSELYESAAARKEPQHGTATLLRPASRPFLVVVSHSRRQWRWLLSFGETEPIHTERRKNVRVYWSRRRDLPVIRRALALLG